MNCWEQAQHRLKQHSQPRWIWIIRMYILLLIRSIYVSPEKNQHVYCFSFLVPNLGGNNGDSM